MKTNQLRAPSRMFLSQLLCFPHDLFGSLTCLVLATLVIIRQHAFLSPSFETLEQPLDRSHGEAQLMGDVLRLSPVFPSSKKSSYGREREWVVTCLTSLNDAKGTAFFSNQRCKVRATGRDSSEGR